MNSRLSLLAGFVCVLLTVPLFSITCPSSVWTTVQSRQDGPFMIHDLAPVDFDNDGKLDLVGLIDQSPISDSGMLYAWKGNGDGTFQAPVSLADSGLSFLSVADVNNDGRKDLLMTKTTVVNNSYSYSLLVRLGNGAGFNAAQSRSINNPTRFVTTLFDGDAYPDIVMPDYGTIQIYHGVGDGTFTFLKQIPLTVQSAFRVAAADFDGDGRLDLAYARDDTYFVDVIFQNADGSFTAPVTLQSGVEPPSGYQDVAWDLVTGDVDEDTHPDLIAANWEGQYAGASVTVLRYGGSRTFTRSTLSPAYFHAPVSFTTVRVADINGDGHLDILAGEINGSLLMTSIGRGDGTFYSPSYYKPDAGVVSIAIGDFDGDTHLDAIVSGFQHIGSLAATCQAVVTSDGRSISAAASAGAISAPSTATATVGRPNPTTPFTAPAARKVSAIAVAMSVP